MPADSIVLASAAELAALVRRGVVTPSELLEHAIARYERHNPAVNAVVVTRIDAARAHAAQLDREAAAGTFRGPLHGVPMTIKEAYDWADTPPPGGTPHGATTAPAPTRRPCNASSRRGR